MRLSELQDKDIVNLNDGKKVGKVIDVIIDDNGTITSFVIQKTKLFNLIPGGGEVEIRWNQIKTIGDDVILIDSKKI